MSISADNGETFTIIPHLSYVSGDIGAGIMPGPNKQILWRAGSETMPLDGNQFRVKLKADDATLPEAPPNFIEMPGRPFIMGRTIGTGDEDDYPAHLVTLSPYAICKYETTQSEWQAIMGSNPAYGYGVGPNFPVYNVSWYSILKYCNLKSISENLDPVYSINGSTNPQTWGTVPTSSNVAWKSAICNLTANGYRLPTEAEWEYAARGGTNYPDYVYSGSNVLNTVGWYVGNNTPYGVKAVGTKAPNHLGIHDMSGNLWEYCWDWFTPYPAEDQVNPLGGPTGIHRIARGGYWLNQADVCQVHHRSGYWDYTGSYWMGFRLAKSLNY
jgi:formylglycine-generating enzyme required for sulfatase activity